MTSNVTPQHSMGKRSTIVFNGDYSVENSTNLKIVQGGDGQDGQDGHDGLPGQKGEVGSRGPKGNTGALGPKGKNVGGVVYVRWGHNSCPDSGAQLVYAGRAGGSHYAHTGSGGDPQCLPMDPKFNKTVPGNQDSALIFGAEYETSQYPFAKYSQDGKVLCAVCYVPNRNALYMIPAKDTCPAGWTREYFGYLMSEFYGHHRSEYTCVDHSLTPATEQVYNNNDGLLFYMVQAQCGALPCPPYVQDNELTCTVCTK